MQTTGKKVPRLNTTKPVNIRLRPMGLANGIFMRIYSEFGRAVLNTSNGKGHAWWAPPDRGTCMRPCANTWASPRTIRASI